MPVHDIEPVYDKDSRILILGSFPSVRSRETGFFYGHPQNRFWKITASLFDEKVPETIEEKKAFLLRNRIALWDVIASCDITGSSDLSIKNVRVTDVARILKDAHMDAERLLQTIVQRLVDPRDLCAFAVDGQTKRERRPLRLRSVCAAAPQQEREHKKKNQRAPYLHDVSSLASFGFYYSMTCEKRVSLHDENR